ncbi:hypothetical protein R1flu_013878 [Riccia fluitans]|uniref:Uncharacterized protein n=1 Tax=Riccia fluitans TaxID=41844 RepID=A0ABD1YEM6_9MARC
MTSKPKFDAYCRPSRREASAMRAGMRSPGRMLPAPETGAGAGAEAEAMVSRASTPLLPTVRTTASKTKRTDTILPLKAILSAELNDNCFKSPRFLEAKNAY